MQTFLMDAIVVAAFVIIVAIFTYRGLAKSVMGFLVVFASFLVCKFFGGMVGEWIDSALLFNPISSWIRSILENTIGETVGAIDGAGLFEAMPKAVKNILDFAGADMEALESYMMNFEGNVSDGLTQMAGKIAAPISSAIATLLAYIILFALSMIVFKLVATLLLKVFELPVLSAVNRVGGFAVGLVAGFIFCWVGVKLFTVIIGLLALGNPALAEFSNFEETLIFSFFAKF